MQAFFSKKRKKMKFFLRMLTHCHLVFLLKPLLKNNLTNYVLNCRLKKIKFVFLKQFAQAFLTH